MKFMKTLNMNRPGVALTLAGGLLVGAVASVASTGAPEISPSGPAITIVGGDNETAATGVFNARPFDIAIWNAAGTQPLVGREVTFTVESGGGLLASSNAIGALPSPSLTVKTDQDGTAQAYYQQPLSAGTLSTIRVSVASAELVLHTRSLGIGEVVEEGGGQAGHTKSTVVSGGGLSGISGALAAGSTGAGSASSGLALRSRAASVGNNLHALVVSAGTVKLRLPPAATATVSTGTWALSTP